MDAQRGRRLHRQQRRLVHHRLRRERQDASEWLQDDLVGKGLTGPVAPGKLDRQAAFEAFTEGEVGMLNGHPTLMQATPRRPASTSAWCRCPGADGTAKATMGVADWMMAFKQNGHGKQIGKFLDFVYNDKNVMDFADKYDLLPVTTYRATSHGGRHAGRRPEALPAGAASRPSSTRSASSPGRGSARTSRRTSARRSSPGRIRQRVLDGIAKRAQTPPTPRE